MAAPTKLAMQRRFVGIDTHHAPQDLGPGMLQAADNVLVDGGEVVTRPGKQGQLSSPLGSGIYSLVSYVTVDASGATPAYTTRFLFISGGKVYRWNKGATSATEVLIGGTTSFALQSASAYLERVGRYVYVVDGNVSDTPIAGGTPLYRISLDATGAPTATVVTGQAAPSTPPAAVAGNQPLDPMTSLSGWQVDTVTGDGVNALANGGDLSLFTPGATYGPGATVGISYTDLAIDGSNNKIVTSAAHPFTTALTGLSLVVTTGTGGWTAGTYTIDSVDTSGKATLHSSPGTAGSTSGHGSVASVWTVTGGSGQVLDFDTSGSGTFPVPSGYGGTWCLCDEPSNGIQTALIQNAPIANALGETRYARQFRASLLYYCPQNPNKQGFTIRVDTWLDTAGVTPGPSSERSFVPNTSVGQQPGQFWSEIFTFPDGPDIRSYKVTLMGASSNKKFFGVYFGSPSFAPISNQLRLIPSGGMYVDNGYTARGNGPANNGRFGAATITRDFGSNQDWSAYSRITLNLTTAGSSLDLQALVDAGLSLRLGLRPNGSTTHSYSNPLTIDPTTGTASVDITTIPADVRAAFRYLEIDFLADLSSAPTAFTPVFTITSITSGGNLSVSDAETAAVSAPYTWVFTEVNASADPANLVDVVESDPSPVSQAVQMSLALSTATVTLPAAADPATTHYYVYRYGGVLSDGVYRLVAILPVGSDTLPAIAPDAAGYVTWNHASRILTDNTPDAYLLSSLAVSLITGRGLPPAGAQTLAAWQGRLWLAKGSTLYGSWIVSENNASALYFNSINLPNDPYGDVKGIQVSVGGDDNDPIQRLFPLGTSLVILKQRSVWVLTGFTASDFQLSSYLTDAQIGCVAPRACAKVGNALWFLGPDGVMQFDGDVVHPMSLPVEKLLNPALSGGSALQPSAYAASAMLWAGRRLYLFAPGSASETQNTAAYVWDSRQDGWTRLLDMNATGGVALSSGSDAAEIYLGGLDGQIYELAGTGDKATPSSQAASIAFLVASRGMGQESEAPDYWYDNLPVYLYLLATTGEEVTMTYEVAAARSESTFSESYAWNGRLSIRKPAPVDIRGDYMTIQVSGSCVAPTRITALGIEYAEDKPSVS